MIEPSASFHRFLIKDAVPFGEALPTLINGYCAAYQIVSDLQKNAGTKSLLDQQYIEAVNSCFYQYIAHLSNHVDPHLAQGPFGTFRVIDVDGGPNKYHSRYSLIFLRAFSRSRTLTELVRDRTGKGPPTPPKAQRGIPPSLIYSPLWFCKQILTSPEFPASEALALAVIRAYIFEQTLAFEGLLHNWKGRGSKEKPPLTKDDRNVYLRIRDIISFDNVEATLNKLESYTKRKRDNLPIKDATDFLVGHYLASKGLLMLRYSGPDGAIDPKSDDKLPSLSLESFLSGGTLANEIGVYEFDKPREVRRLPSAAELMNELDGIPIAIPGANHVFQGGIRVTTHGGLVGRVQGTAGIGKTSLALAIAASLAVLGTQTLYLSCEEEEEDLLQRIRTLIPPFFKRTQSYRDPSKWFASKYIAGSDVQKREAIIDFLENAISRHQGLLPNPSNCPPGLTPLFIVLDGVHEMFPSDAKEPSGRDLRNLIQICKATGAFVLAMSAENLRFDLDEFDYLVDLVISLEYAAVKAEMDPPGRLFRLWKTRRQLSRTGSHIFELSREGSGIAIFPHLHTFLDEFRERYWVEPSRNYTIDFLLAREGSVAGERTEDGAEQPLVEIQDRSQVLVMGRGSSGKALFGMRILGSGFVNDGRLTEFFERRRRQRARDKSPPLPFPKIEASAVEGEPESVDYPWFEDVDPSRRRILVLSFLYEAQLYTELLRKSKRYWSKDAIEGNHPPNIHLEVEHFPPGFLRPEEFISTIVDRLDAAMYAGFPYHGVLIDGVHNVFLQYPRLEASEIVWPTLYQLLRTRGISVVTTHTYFDVSEYGSAAGDMETSRRRASPLLHALVQSSDYVIKIHPVSALKYEECDFAAAFRENFNLDNPDAAKPKNFAAKSPRPALYLIEVPGALTWSHADIPVDWGWDRYRGVAFQARALGAPPRPTSTSRIFFGPGRSTIRKPRSD